MLMSLRRSLFDIAFVFCVFFPSQLLFFSNGHQSQKHVYLGPRCRVSPASQRRNDGLRAIFSN